MSQIHQDPAGFLQIPHGSAVSSGFLWVPQDPSDSSTFLRPPHDSSEGSVESLRIPQEPSGLLKDSERVLGGKMKNAAAIALFRPPQVAPPGGDGGTTPPRNTRLIQPQYTVLDAQ